ncbi:MAG: DNA translocase FtsK [Alphaproteobacteria bacterium]|nr:DNA translocase FtsK [Alphaproteobacteria bacterium]
MSEKSKFLPDSVSGALRGFVLRLCGGAVICVASWAVVALLFNDPYLDGVVAAGDFGRQGIMGNFVSILRYTIGYIPALFLLLCFGRYGITLALGGGDGTPEYNILRGFVGICLGAAGLGLVAPRATFGGMCGAVAAADLGGLVGGFGFVIGVLCLIGFLWIAGILLHIGLADVLRILRAVWRTLRWILTAFHLMRPIESDDEEETEESEQEVEEEETEEEEEVVEKPRRRSVRRRTASATIEYELPDPEFLEQSMFGKSVVTPELKRQASLLETHFAQYNVHGTVTGIRPGPIVTLYEFMPDDGTKIADVTKTVKDMTRAMATENIRIAHIPSTQLIGVEMVNLKRQMVRFRELVESDMFVNSKYKIPLALGVNIGGGAMYFDLAKMPHMLIAGRTGSGKSVFVQTIITSIVYHFTPDKCKLMIIDPKGVDFGFWDDIPHLITPIVKLDAAAAVNALKWAVREMEDRYKQLQVVSARNIESYNEIVAAKRAAGEKITQQVAVGTDEETGELLFETQQVELNDMPYIVIIIDEVADLMSLARKEVEACVQRIAQKARAAGIHLVMATQRPDATTITGVIKANFPTRVSFQARSVIDSMTTLGEKGAEQLLAMGDMLFSEAGRVPVRIHAAFISDEELTRIGDFLRAQGEPEYAEGVTSGDDGDANQSSGGGMMPGVGGAASSGDKDADLYAQAKEYVLRDKKPTISYIQRRLSVGYNKAAGFMERMETEGIVSAPDANGKRHIL